MEDIKHLRKLLTDVATGEVSVNDATNSLLDPAAASESGLISKPVTPSSSKNPGQGVSLDLDRERRCGFPEVIYGEGKPPAMIIDIMRQQQSAGQSSLATRVDPNAVAEILQQIPDAKHNPIARTVSRYDSSQESHQDASIGVSRQPLSHSTEPHPGRHVAVITAGSTDAPVAEEAIETLKWMNIPFRSFTDIGVAGPARLLAAVPALRQATAVIVIAGMEGALPAAVGGHLSVPVFAVPTSVGYGATLGGLTPMLGMLSSCASNVAVVNIDAGFKGAYLAGLVVKGTH